MDRNEPKNNVITRCCCEIRIPKTLRIVLLFVTLVLLFIFKAQLGLMQKPFANKQKGHGENDKSFVLEVTHHPSYHYIEHEDKDDNIEFKLDGCNCKRRLQHSVKALQKQSTKVKDLQPTNLKIGHVRYNETTCSQSAFIRGSGQKVIGFSIYGDMNSNHSRAKGYFEGISENLSLISIYYPGWLMRLYHDVEKHDLVMKDLCNLACSNQNLDLCDVHELPGTPMVNATRVFPMDWRWFPTMDPQVDIFASRDLDSRLSAREVAAVNEWLYNSTKPIHAMRDNPWHNIGMLGGAWDTDLTRETSRKGWRDAWNEMMKDPLINATRDKNGPDQLLLNRHVWRNNRFGHSQALQHDSYFCQRYKGSISWPTKRLLEPNNFVGSVVKQNSTLSTKCPIKCRRQKDWDYC